MPCKSRSQPWHVGTTPEYHPFMKGTGLFNKSSLMLCSSAQRWHPLRSSCGGVHPQIVEIRLIMVQSPEVSLCAAIATSASQSAHVAPTPSDGSIKGTGVSKKDDCTGVPSAHSVHLVPMLVSSGTSSAVTPRTLTLRKMTDQRMKRRPPNTGVIGLDLAFILNAMCRTSCLASSVHHYF